MDPVKPSKNSVRNGDGITGMKQGDPGEQTSKLQGHDNGYESESISCLVSRKRDGITEMKRGEQEENVDHCMDHVRYRPFYKAVQENDWRGIEDLTRKDPQLLTAKIKVCYMETIFHIITRNLDAPMWLMKNLASKVTPELLESLTDCSGRSALFQAATCGNTKAAEAFVSRNQNLPNIRNSEGLLPIHLAAEYGHKEITRYLLSVTRIALDDDKGVQLLQALIRSGLYGIALDLFKRYPRLGCELQSNDRGSILAILASKPLQFESGCQLGYWERLIYNWIPVQEEHIPRPQSVDGDVENSIESSKKLRKFTLGSILQQIFTPFVVWCQKLYIMLWNVLLQLVPGIKCIRATKLTHIQALKIVKIMCHEGVIWSNKEACSSLSFPIVTAVRLGICELVHEIVKAHYHSYTFNDGKGHDLFHLAILHRQEKVFNILNKTYSFEWGWEMAVMSLKTDNILHTVGRLVPSTQVAGAALQMQRELQWFKAVESYVHPSLQEHLNSSDKTPREVFTEEHKNLVKEGEKWMKDTASSCTVVATLIITVVFAAAFTVPGGKKTVRMPKFSHETSLIIFEISDGLALFSSTASVLMFLAILTSRYSEDDFLESLPKKLIIGLITLFFSIASMMIAFVATTYIFLSQPLIWTIIPISLLGCLPVTLFVMLQFPLLLEIFLSTYRTSILQPGKVRMQ